MAKSHRLTDEELAAQEERSRRFRELLERRAKRDEELKAARRKDADARRH
ncbi:MAG: hypothetical protein ACRDNB_02950 [Gaiellaceae bacterium]